MKIKISVNYQELVLTNLTMIMQDIGNVDLRQDALGVEIIVHVFNDESLSDIFVSLERALINFDAYSTVTKPYGFRIFISRK